MMNPRKLIPGGALLALMTAGGLAVAAPAAAQVVEEITVMGRLGPDGRPATLSRIVSYRDLDITTPYGQDELRRRIRDTARDLCSELGEPSRATTGGLLPSCRSEAERDAFASMEVAVANAVPRGAGWAAPSELADVDPPASLAELPPPAPAPSAQQYAEPASVTTRLVTNGPVPDTPENRARFGEPMSRAGKMTAPAGN
jgi:UrcA family protein